MTINPVVPLTVGLAECKGQYGFFLGSGVSVAAGIPSGGEIFNHLRSKLYEQLDMQGQVPFDTWIENNAPTTYSDVFSELTGSDQAARRRLLEPFFIGKNPSTTHEIIAEMVKRGRVRVIVTTNFDDLMETALRNVGQPYSVVTDDDDLHTAEPREQVACRVYKIHGDYRKLNIRNTAEEVDHLPPAITDELREVFSRYGLVVLGYSGGDLGVMRLLDTTTPVYNRYWIQRNVGRCNDLCERLLAKDRHHTIVCENSDTFMVELKHRIEVLETPSGEDSPKSLYDLSVKLLETGSTFQISSLLRQYKARFVRTWPDILRSSGSSTLDSVLNEIKVQLSHIIVLGWALCDFDIPERKQLLEELLGTLSNLSPWIGSSTNELRRQLAQVPLQICMIAWGARGVRRGIKSFLSEIFHANVANFLDDSTTYLTLIPLFKQRFFASNFDAWSTVLDATLWNTIFEHEILDITEFESYCEQFELVKAVKTLNECPDEDLYMFYCARDDYQKVSRIVASLVQTDEWDELMGISGDNRTVLMASLIDKVLRTVGRMQQGLLPIPITPLEHFRRHLVEMGIPVSEVS